MSKTYRKAFEWREVDGVPAAEVVVLNGRGWLLCCPLCGCVHEVDTGVGVQRVGRWAPRCLLRRLAATAASVQRGQGPHRGANWKRVLQDWENKYPKSARHNEVFLVQEQAEQEQAACAR